MTSASASSPASAWSSRLLLIAALGCGPGSVGAPGDETPRDHALDGLAVRSLRPATLVPGSTLVVAGRSFVDAPFGESVLVLAGTLDGAPAEVRLPLRFVDFDEMQVSWGGARAAGFAAAAGRFEGGAAIEVKSKVDGRVYRSEALATTLVLADTLTPRLAGLAAGGVIFVNEPIAIEGEGLLLGGDEGDTVAVVTGCFQPMGAEACPEIQEARIAVAPQTTSGREQGRFAFAPSIAGVRPGEFRGQVRLENPGGATSQAVTLNASLVEPAVFRVEPQAASLGQYVDFHGGGFIGPEAGKTSITALEAAGEFTPQGMTTAVPVTLSLIPEFVSGPLVRYVLNEDDDLGRRIDLRTQAGTFRGTVRPVTTYGADVVSGDAAAITFAITPVKQVVWLRYQPTYVESLRKFGLRAVDREIRGRVLEVARRDYEGVNLEFRAERPTDFALYSIVDIGGPDLNGLGYFGYDNTPGKDVGNLRLHDKIGGLNATTQEDGNPGYGGVFVESLFAFSLHPNGIAEPNDGASRLFDDVFDAFRPDAGGRPVTAVDIAAGIPPRQSGAGCPAPASDRTAQISCAVFVLGSLIGTTMTHEVGHSLGLAAPHGELTQYHNKGDLPNRLMDGGASRTFAERAELGGEGPSVFCDEEYAYLREILRGGAPGPSITRPRCDEGE
jgi:hypothetical protein